MDHDDESLPREALERLVRDHRSAVTAHAMRITGGDRASSEDVVQETFIRAWHHLQRMTEEYGSVRSWLLRVAHNVAVDSLRQRRADPVSDTEIELHLENSREAAADAVDRLLRSLVVNDALSRLDEPHRAVLEGVYLRGQSLADVATHLDVPVGTVKSRAFYGLRRLRELMSDQTLLCTL